MAAHDERRVMQTPFHPRVAAACEVNRWEDWKGYTTPTEYDNTELEYFAIRNSCGVFDMTPMTKYRIRGRDAAPYLDRLVTRDITRLQAGRVMYVCWCNDRGQLLDDGTLFCFGPDDYLLCSQERHLDWLSWSALGFDVAIEDETEQIAALAFQGPTSFAVLNRLGVAGIEQLKPYRFAAYELAGCPLLISRTGFTGDLGYELWVAPEHALHVWDVLFETGQPFGIRPFGSAALQVARIEAGFIQAGVDFVPAEEAVRTDRTRSPYEVGLGWLVALDKGPFNGRQALMQERQNGSRYQLLKLDVEGNKPSHHAFVYDRRKRHVGAVTSACWSPTAKSNLALASVTTKGTPQNGALFAEIYYLTELKWERLMARCAVRDGPFFDPPRRRATPPALF